MANGCFFKNVKKIYYLCGVQLKKIVLLTFKNLKKMTELAKSLKEENNELKLQLEGVSYNNKICKKVLDSSNLLNEMYKSILTKGKFKVKNEEELYSSLFAIGYFTVMFEEEARKRFAQSLNLFDNQEERSQKVYFTYDVKEGWLINYKNAAGIVVQLTPIQLFNSQEYNLLDSIDDLR